MTKISLAAKRALVTEYWCPKVVGELNGREVVPYEGAAELDELHHDDADEFFLTVTGHFRVEFRSRGVELGPGEFAIVPGGVEHRTVADEEGSVLVFEPAATRNAGNVGHPELTAPSGVRT